MCRSWRTARAREVLIIGGGDGGCLREALKHPGVARVTQVEIDAGVIELSRRWLPTLSDGAFDHPKARVVIADGARFAAECRRALRRRDRRFDRPAGPGRGAVHRAVLPRRPAPAEPGRDHGDPVRQPVDPARGAGRHPGGAARRPASPWSTTISAVVPTYIGGAMALGFATDDPGGRDARASADAAAARAVPAGLRYYTPDVHVGRVRPPGLDDRRGWATEPWPGSPIGGLHHETNSFAPQPATFERFVEADGWPPLLRGAAMLPGTAGINLAITGFIDAARPPGTSSCRWSGPMRARPGRSREDAFERLAAMLLARSRRRRPARRPVSRPARRHGHRAPATTARASCSAGCARSSGRRADRGGARPARQRLRGDGRRTATRWSPTAPTRTSISRSTGRALPAAARAPDGRRALGQGVAADRLPDAAALAMHHDRARPGALRPAR